MVKTTGSKGMYATQLEFANDLILYLDGRANLSGILTLFYIISAIELIGLSVVIKLII
jgi:hypothetical protein